MKGGSHLSGQVVKVSSTFHARHPWELFLTSEISEDLAPSIATRRDRNNGTDLVGPLWQEVRNRSASFSGNATLPDVGPTQQRSLRPQKRSREAERSIAYLGGTAPPALTPSSQARNSMKDYSSYTGDTPPARKHYPCCHSL